MTNSFEDVVKKYQQQFGLDNWKIKFEYPKQDDTQLHRAKTLADPRYYTATMTIWPILLADEGIWDEIIIHEMIHIVMALYDFYVDNATKPEMDDLMFTAREGATSQLTSIIIRMKGGIDETNTSI